MVVGAGSKHPQRGSLAPDSPHFPVPTTKLSFASPSLGREDGVNQGKKLLGFPNLEFVDVDKRALGSAQNLQDRYKLAPRDSIHIASAMT